MPATAELVDALRQALGRDLVDAAIRDGMQGKARFYAAELHDGRLHEAGSLDYGRRAISMQGALVWPPDRGTAVSLELIDLDGPLPAAAGRPSAGPQAGGLGSSQEPRRAGNLNLPDGLFSGRSKGVK